MKIAFITPVFPPYWSGIGNAAFHQAKGLAERSFQVTVFTPRYLTSQKVKEAMEGFEVVRISPRFCFGNAAYIPGLKKWLKNFEILFLHYPFFGGAEVVLKLKRHYPYLKLVTLYHMDTQGTGLKRWLFSVHKKFFLPKIIFSSEKIIVTSEDYAQNSNIRIFFKSLPKKFVVIPLGVDTSLFKPALKDQALLAQFGLMDYKVILFVGGLDRAHYFKGLDVILHALTFVAMPCKLIVVGKGELLPHYRQMAKDMGLSARVIFCDSIGNSELPKYYQIADVLVLPSIDQSEAFGLVLLEAMASGKPVIASNVPGVRTVVESSVTGILVKPKDPKDVADAISVILGNDTLATQMGKAGRLRSQSFYDWKLVTDQLQKLFNSLLSSS